MPEILPFYRILIAIIIPIVQDINITRLHIIIYHIELMLSFQFVDFMCNVGADRLNSVFNG